MAKIDKPLREKNIRAMVSYFESGIKTSPLKIGIELEYTIVNSDYSSVSYYENRGTEWLLKELMSNYPQADYDDAGNLLGLAADDKVITLEPAAQVELAVGPYENLKDAQISLSEFERHLKNILEPINCLALTYGYHPTSQSNNLDIIPKLRYELMDSYFENISRYGRCMMRGSASTQISIDYTSSRDCIQKLRCACALTPLISLICDNSPYFEGEKSPHYMIRTKIWQECDPDRCGIIPQIMDKDYTLENYAEYILNTPAILVFTGENKKFIANNKTFSNIYADKTMNKKDIEHALSMNFADVRLKNCIEIRPADAMPIPYTLAYAAFIKGLFYHDKSFDALLQLFSNVDEKEINRGKEELMIHGYKGKLYGKPVGDLADKIMYLAYEGLNNHEKSFLDPLAELVSERKTLAEKHLDVQNEYTID